MKKNSKTAIIAITETFHTFEVYIPFLVREKGYNILQLDIPSVLDIIRGIRLLLCLEADCLDSLLFLDSLLC